MMVQHHLSHVPLRSLGLKEVFDISALVTLWPWSLITTTVLLLSHCPLWK